MPLTLRDILYNRDNPYWYQRRAEIRVRAGRILDLVLRILNLTGTAVVHISPGVWRSAVLQIEAFLLIDTPAQLRLVNLGDSLLERDDIRRR